MEELHSEIRSADERAKKSQMDVARMAEELRAEQEHCLQIERIRKSLETNIKEVTVRCEQAEAGGLKGGRKALNKLEQRVCNVNYNSIKYKNRHSDLS